jgi:hypothetical protein
MTANRVDQCPTYLQRLDTRKRLVLQGKANLSNLSNLFFACARVHRAAIHDFQTRLEILIRFEGWTGWTGWTSRSDRGLSERPTFFIRDRRLDRLATERSAGPIGGLNPPSFGHCNRTHPHARKKFCAAECLNRV